ncbi:MAG: hypothetical protein EAZ97_05915 [Bacteroidetes bacterium]|nr:MAG: hypothetical protein EAZ97_05915 [Bacteroidota bacterium]
MNAIRQLYFYLFLLFICSQNIFAQSPPTLALNKDKQQIDSSKQKKIVLPIGLADFVYKKTATTNEYNALWWSPFLKGGAGMIDRQNQKTIKYAGVFWHPQRKIRNFGELLFGGHYIDDSEKKQVELKGEYRFPFGLGVGAGFADFGLENKNISFYRISFHQKNKNWNYILSTQIQQVGNFTSYGTYLAYYDDKKMFAAGVDSEQYRLTFGYMAEIKKYKIYRLAFEAIWADRTLGTLYNNQNLLISGTFGYKGGFLSNEARLGRAMSASGLENTNPIIYLNNSWNRLLNLWEIGGLMNFRFTYNKISANNYSARAESIVFPFQYDRFTQIWDSFFVGGYHTRTYSEKNTGIMLGWKQSVTIMNMAFQAEYDLNKKQFACTLGISKML